MSLLSIDYCILNIDYSVAVYRISNRRNFQYSLNETENRFINKQNVFPFFRI